MPQFTITFDVPKIPQSSKLLAIAEHSARNLVSLFADHESGINRALTESEDNKTTLSHAIILDLGKNKQTDRLTFTLKGGDEITESIPDPDQPDLFQKEKPLSGMRRADGVVVEAEVIPALPAPVMGLPRPERGPEEHDAFEAGRQAFIDAQAKSNNPHPLRSLLHDAWDDGWEAESNGDQQAEDDQDDDIPIGWTQRIIDELAAEIVAAKPTQVVGVIAQICSTTAMRSDFVRIIRAALTSEKAGKNRKGHVTVLEAELVGEPAEDSSAPPEGVTVPDSQEDAPDEERSEEE